MKIKVDHIDDDKVVVERFWEKNLLIDEFRQIYNKGNFGKGFNEQKKLFVTGIILFCYPQ